MTIDQTLCQKVPVPYVLLDTDLNLVDFTDEWLEQFQQLPTIKGKSFFTCMPDIPEELKIDLNYCLEGVGQRSDEKRIVLQNGDAIWYQWKIKAIKNPKNEIEGILLVLEDITKIKLKETLLKRAQEVARIGGWEVDLVKNKVYWTNVTREIHEVPADYVPTVANGISFYKEGYSRDTIANLVQNAITTGTPWDVELQLITAKGKEIWVRAIGEPELVNGKCVRLTGTFQDIGPRKKAEIKYSHVSDRLALATKSAGIGIWEYDIPNNQLLWDQNMYDLYGIKAADFGEVYEAWEALVIPEDKERFNQEVLDAIDGIKNFNTTFRVKLPSGEIRWIKAEGTVIRDSQGAPLKMVGINQDINQLKTTQLQLLQSEESLQGAFENSSIGMALVDVTGKFIQVNQSLCISLGYTSQELLALTFQDITHPDDLEKDMMLLAELKQGKRASYQIEKRYFDKTGQLVHIFLTVTAVRTINGEISHFISQIVDISPRMVAEEKLKSLLELTTNQNTSLLNFAHIVSHNLRSHSANLTMISRFLLDETLPEDDRKQTLDMLGRASNGLNETITHLNEVVQVKLETEKNLKPIPLRKTIDKVVEDISALINENEVEINIEVPSQIKIKGVPAYLESIILNLITNGIKYRDREKKSHIQIKITSDDRFKILTVADNGIGIDLERHGKKIFGMYKTFHGNQDARGIGLFITKNQIESMGGTITVASEIGKGTEFKVKLLKA